MISECMNAQDGRGWSETPPPPHAAVLRSYPMKYLPFNSRPDIAFEEQILRHTFYAGRVFCNGWQCGPERNKDVCISGPVTNFEFPPPGPFVQ